MPPSLQEWLPEGDLAWFILDVVGQLDLKEFAWPLTRGIGPKNFNHLGVRDYSWRHPRGSYSQGSWFDLGNPG